MKPMLLTAATDIPTGKDWLYEVKYDGFRCLLEWVEETPILKSRNGKVLNPMFPEIIAYCQDIYQDIRSFLPLMLDGELVYLVNNQQSNFSLVQMRSRMRTQSVINHHSQEFPCHYVAFDLLTSKGVIQHNLSFSERKLFMRKMFKSLNLPQSVNYQHRARIQMVEETKHSKKLWHQVKVNNGEGIVAKEKTSKWHSDKRTGHWKKIKNWRYVTVILSKYDHNNGFFHGSIYAKGKLIEVVTFRHGLKKEEMTTLKTLFESNGTLISSNVWELDPSICVDIACIDFDGKHLREPRFHAFVFDQDPSDCDWKHMQRQLYPLPENVKITNPDKPVWPLLGLNKDDYLLYLQHVSPHILPFLQDRHLTVIRFPHGAEGESFYQKNAPDTIPSFLATSKADDITHMVCNNLESLLWLGNQLALEFHIPFQTIATDKPTEIVFDLDPPSVQEFPLAIEAAQRMKTIFDQFGLNSFVKTSGRKGLQVYIPLPVNRFSYDETRVFTKFVSDFLCEQEPQWFTTERLIKNRHNKLYLDYVQHHEGKTIIAPYSARGIEQGLIATPLTWYEVNDSLKPDLFSIPAVLERLKNKGNPFRDFREKADELKFADVLSQLKELVKSKA